MKSVPLGRLVLSGPPSQPELRAGSPGEVSHAEVPGTTGGRDKKLGSSLHSASAPAGRVCPSGCPDACSGREANRMSAWPPLRGSTSYGVTACHPPTHILVENPARRCVPFLEPLSRSATNWATPNDRNVSSHRSRGPKAEDEELAEPRPPEVLSGRVPSLARITPISVSAVTRRPHLVCLCPFSSHEDTSRIGVGPLTPM